MIAYTVAGKGDKYRPLAAKILEGLFNEGKINDLISRNGHGDEAILLFQIKEVFTSYCKAGGVLSNIKRGQMRTQTAIISIQDLTSEAIPTLTQVLNAVPGVQSVDFSLERGVAVVEFDRQQSIVDDLLRAVLKAGYKVG